MIETNLFSVWFTVDCHSYNSTIWMAHRSKFWIWMFRSRFRIWECHKWYFLDDFYSRFDLLTNKNRRWSSIHLNDDKCKSVRFLFFLSIWFRCKLGQKRKDYDEIHNSFTQRNMLASHRHRHQVEHWTKT